MKVHPNDFKTRSSKDIRKIIINKKSNVVSPNNQKATSSIFKANKTIQKYINSRLNSINKSHQNELFQKEKIKTKFNFKNHPNIIKNKLSFNSTRYFNNKSIEKIKKPKNNNSKTISKNISKQNSKHKKNDNNIYNSKDHSHNSSLNKINPTKNKENTKESKLINSVSTSSGISYCSNENKKCSPNSKEKKEIYNKNDDNKNLNNNIYNYNEDSNPIMGNYDYNSKNFLEETNRARHNINNFNYESGSDDNFSENKIFLKCDDYSLLTFGNSFSYSNSQRSKSTKRKGNIEEKNEDNNKISIFCNDLINNYNNNKNSLYVNKLKEENETLKKELKESSEQISFLMYQIKELKESKNYHSKKLLRNKACSPNIWKNKNLKFSFVEKTNNINNKDKREVKKKEDKKNLFNKDILKDIFIK